MKPLDQALTYFKPGGPTIVSMSGGRTSSFMLWLYLQANGGRLPDDVHVCFANTGKERPETLDFVQACGTHWNVPIVWLDYRREGGFEIVSHNTASRNGEPFAELIGAKSYLPNPVTRFCTIELKIRTMKKFARSIGWDHWENAVGLRADEPHRVAKISNQKDRWDTIAPLFAAGVTKRDVGAFWSERDFDLRLPNVRNATPHGNCDLCFLKSAATIAGLIREEPSSADWWIEQEKRLEGKTSSYQAARFRSDRPGYAEIKAATEKQQDFFTEIDGVQDCFCHD